MNGKLKTAFLYLTQSYVFIMAVAIIAGLVWSEQFGAITFLSTVMLQIIFFLSSLKIGLEQVKKAFTKVNALVVVSIFMLIVLPVAVYYISLLIVPELAIALMILAAMPAGMTAPLLTEVVGGDVSYSLVLTVTTSLLAPLTIPLVIKLLIGTQISISFFDMLLKLIYVIVIPFILATFVKRYFHKQIKGSFYTFKPISLVLLGLLIAVLVAKNAPQILSDFGNFFWYLFVLIVFFALIHVIGYYLVVWEKPIRRLTITVNVTYMNFTLAIYLAAIYFNQPNVILPLVISIIPWALLLIPFKRTVSALDHRFNT